MSKQDLQSLKSDLQEIKGSIPELTSELNTLIQQINNNRSSNRIDSKPTGNEIGSMDHPASDLQQDKNELKTIKLNYSVIKNVENKFSNIEDCIESIKNTTEGINSDAIRRSNTLGEIVNQSFGLYDDLSCTVFDDRITNNRSLYQLFRNIYNIKYKNGELINSGNPYVLKDEKDDVEDNIENIIETLTSYSNSIDDIINRIKSTNVEEITEEIDKSRENEMRKEAEQMKPFMHLHTIEGVCEVHDLWGQKIEVSKLAKLLSDNNTNRIKYSEDTVRDMLDDVEEITPIGSGVNIQKLDKSTYKITN